MQTEVIEDEVMKRRGLSLADRPLGRVMLARVHSCLRAQRKRDVVRSRKVVNSRIVPIQWILSKA
jgi:hypothetical protein